MEFRAPEPLDDDVVQQVLDARVWSHDGISSLRNEDGLGLVAARAFRAGDTIYSTDVLALSDDDHAYTARIIIDDVVEFVPVSSHHTVRFDGIRWLDVPGCFMNHACEPTTASVFHQPDGPGGVLHYDQIALVDLTPGDELTCDYTRFDWGDDGLAFACACGSPDCYGWIDGFGGLPRTVQERTSDSVTMEAARRWALLGADEAGTA